MERARLFAMVFPLVVSSAPSFAQDWIQPARGPIGRSLVAEAAKLAASSHAEPRADDGAWPVVEKLEPGTQVAVLDREGNLVEGHFAEADEDSLLLRDGALTNRLNRAEVLEISKITPGKGSASVAAGFALAGGVAAFLVDVRIGFSPCYGGCGGNVATMIGASVGLPLAGGFGGYYGSRKPARRLIYRSS